MLVLKNFKKFNALLIGKIPPETKKITVTDREVTQEMKKS